MAFKPLKLLFVADGRSPIALNWIDYFIQQGHQVHLASSYPCSPDLCLASLEIVPAAFGEMAGGLEISRKIDNDAGGRKTGRATRARSLIRKSIPVRARTGMRQWFGPLTLPRAARRLQEVAGRIRPDLVHAMRIPYEGMLAAMADLPAPLLISVWGNDFTLHAGSTPLMARYTRQAMRRASALHTDCFRDLRLAKAWGFSEERPARVLPGNGGLQLGVFYPAKGREQRPIPGNVPTVINPRGIRAYVRIDTFFRAVPYVLEQNDSVRFVCTEMAGEARAQRWVGELGITSAVELLPRQSRRGMADLFRQSDLAVSPATHDGTPNTLLEAMACGCFPIAGDIESLREWITPGVNGMLFDPANPRQLAQAILKAIASPELRRSAFEQNLRLVSERADYQRVMPQAEGFYRSIMP